MAMGDKVDPKYKVKHRVTSVRRLLRYERVPPPMVDDPPEAFQSRDWRERCVLVYWHMIAIKHGAVPPSRRCGLWFYAEQNQTRLAA